MNKWICPWRLAEKTVNNKSSEKKKKGISDHKEEIGKADI